MYASSSTCSSAAFAHPHSRIRRLACAEEQRERIRAVTVQWAPFLFPICPLPSVIVAVCVWGAWRGIGGMDDASLSSTFFSPTGHQWCSGTVERRKRERSGAKTHVTSNTIKAHAMRNAHKASRRSEPSLPLLVVLCLQVWFDSLG